MPEFDFLDDVASRPAPPPTPPRKRKAGRNPFLRAVAILAMIMVVILLGLPFVLASFAGRKVVLGRGMTNTARQVAIAGIMRPYVLPRDSSITPLQAGTLAASIMGTRNDSLFPLTSVPPRADPPWMEEEITPEMFRDAQPAGGEKRLPGANRVLLLATGRFSKDEMDFLERVAHAPLWKDVETIARAPAVDVVGGRFRIPFPDTVSSFELPTPRFARTKSLAYAGVSRAAYYLARNQRDSAEHALLVVSSLGFATMDNASTLIENLIGAVIVGVGRAGIIQLDSITGNPRGAALKRQLDSLVASFQATKNTEPLEGRARVIALAGDPHTPRAQRFEMLMQLSMLPCFSARGLLFGLPGDVDSVFAKAERDLARYPSEVALVDLIRHTSARPIHVNDGNIPGIVMGAASFTSGVLRTKRPLTCAGVLAMRN